jgi:hypothetical protein
MNSSEFTMRSKLLFYPALVAVAVFIGANTADAHLFAAYSTSSKLVTPKITVGLDAASYPPAATATLFVTENIKAARTMTVADTSGAAWSKVSDDGTNLVFTAKTTDVDATVTVTMTRTVDGAKASGSASYQVNPTPQVSASLDQATYDRGATATLTVTDNIRVPRTLAVQDTSGAVWTKTSDDGGTAVFTAGVSGSGGTVTVTMTRTRDGATASDSAAYSTRQWAGQKPGQVILGMSCGTVCTEKESELAQPFGVHRQYKNWRDWSGVAQDIQEDHAAGRLPWVSVKSPGGASGWQAVASGAYDADIRNLATVLKANDDKPIILTFHHEPSNDGTEAQGADWAAAYVHFNDVLDAEGALVNTSDVPIVGDWLFNPSNRTQDPANWVTDAVLKRAPFLGVDMYENASGATYATRIPFITDWMASRGFPDKQVGIGETGSTDYYAKSTAVKWMNDSLNWAIAHPDQVGVVSYFNSTANSRDGVYWPLDESTSKLTAYRSFLDSALTAP